MSDLTRTDRDAIVSKVIETVQTKHFDPHFEKERWKSAVEQQRSRIVDAADTSDFETALSDLVRSFGTPDAGFFHERSRKKVPKGLAARFQYCQPNECAPTFTQPSDAGDVMISKIADGVGWLKVTKFPGTIGIDIAKEIDHGIEELRGCDRLVVDLRGNAGGGLAFLRVMSYLTPERLPVGYSVTRARAETNYSKETLTIFDRIPSRKAALIWLVLKFGFRDDSVSILTEGLGSMPFHGRTAILVDESTTGAGERIAAFAQERKLAPVVGARTAGRLICCSVYKVGHGYYVRIPARAWYTWSGELLEAKGVVPDCIVTDGQGGEADLQLERAVDVVRSL
ncbi:MAG: carboxyl-terminal processing protease [Acidobacteriaceae bacterium]|nr:carboxyl-terminal processing protease [Acidobacteriaceae bacterium]